ncbi:PPR containing plant-like protein [Medicago truncatula]|uniref:PPR containing plant-like protein n=1 Tax=Medicago truncatula TaxID=3880 RepID=A0A072TC07_MEDTR|nr:PPR containing plant-like protein [Medicago truncatula]
MKDLGVEPNVIVLMLQMEENGLTHDVVTYETIIRALFKNRKNDKAEKILHEMIDRGLL